MTEQHGHSAPTLAPPPPPEAASTAALPPPPAPAAAEPPPPPSPAPAAPPSTPAMDPAPSVPLVPPVPTQHEAATTLPPTAPTSPDGPRPMHPPIEPLVGPLDLPTLDLPPLDLPAPADDAVVIDVVDALDTAPPFAAAPLAPPAELAAPAEFAAPAEINPPADLAAPVEMDPPAELAAPVEMAAPAEMAPPAELAAPVEMPAPAEMAPPAAPAAPVELAAPAPAPPVPDVDAPTAPVAPAAIPTPPVLLTPPPSDWSSPATKRRRRTPSAGVKQIGTAVLLGALGIGGLVAAQQLGEDPAPPPVPPPATVPVEQVDEPTLLPVLPDAGAGSTGIGIVDDADELVDQINDNAEEAAALELLDLDTAAAFSPAGDAVIFTGDEIATGAASVLDAQSYSFSWSYPAGTSITAWIDASTGDFQMTTAANHVLRSVDGLLYEQAAPGGQWSLSPLQEFADRAFVGRDELLTSQSMLPDELLAFATLTEIDANGFGSYLIDDVALHRDDPQLRSDWLTIWGFDASVVADSTAAHDGELPDVAGEGQILIHTEGGLDSVVTTATVSTSQGASTYVLLEASRDERAIVVPDVG